jgi:hypothetical protein
LHLLLTHY